jgi:hypothetical protein
LRQPSQRCELRESIQRRRCAMNSATALFTQAVMR